MAAEEGLVLSLQEALRRWCDRDLVAAVLTEERTYTAHELAAYPHAPLSSLDSLRKATGNDWMLGGRIFSRLDLAWRTLEGDFVARMQRGEFQLTGTETAPELTEGLKIIPGAWAGECTFDFARGGVAIGVRRYADIRVRRPPVPDSSVASDTGQVSLEGAPGDERNASRKRQTGGRESYTPLITAMLREKYADQQMTIDPGQTWSGMAKFLRSKMAKRYPGRHASGKLPNEETIRTRLPGLYLDLLRERGVLLPDRSTEQ